MISLSFYGAAGSVTGSKTLITVNQRRYLIDCGMFQGRKELRQKNWLPPQFDPSQLEAVIITHAHLDHIGYLPVLYKRGFRGKIYGTPPTVELAQILLLDSAHIQEEDAEYRNRKKATSHEIALPLYTTEDVKNVSKLFHKISFRTWKRVGQELKFRYHPSGHILGAASVETILDDETKETSVLFSGDIGRYAVPLVHDPVTPPECDYLVCESTYGGEVHKPLDIYFEMAEIIDKVINEKAILLIPAFSVGRTQQVTYVIGMLIKQGRIPPIPVHIDSPMAVRVTDVYKRYPSYHQINRELLKKSKNVFYGKNVTLHRKRKSSKKLNKLRGPAIIMSASGMMTGGRIMHHLINRLPNPKTILALVGYMAEGTLGRKILEGDKTVYIHKQPVEVKAQTVKLLGLSGHADSYELFHWLEPWKEKPKKVFVIHGEPTRSNKMAEDISAKLNWETVVPKLNETFEL